MIHNIPESKNAQDVTKIDCRNVPFGVDLLTYGFPCQDISAAGLQRGFSDENVKALTSKKFQKEFEIVLSSLQAAGYVNFWRVLNSKDYGIPQNRERVFIVSIRSDLAHGFTFPAPFPLEYRLKDFLEPVVDEKYYINTKRVLGIDNEKPALMYDIQMQGIEKKAREYEDISPAILARDYKDPKLINDTKLKLEFLRIPEPTATGYKDAFAGDCVNVGFPNSKTRRGRVTSQMSAALITSSQLGVVVESGVDGPAEPRQIAQIYSKEKNPQSGRVYDQRGICPTITTPTGGNLEPKTTDGLRIRKLTPLECFRLMDFDDSDAQILAANGFSNAQIYKLAGNSIVVNVLQCLFSEIFKQYGEIFKPKQQTFFDLLGESGVDDSANDQTSIFDYL